jgi:hypothetical protein
VLSRHVEQPDEEQQTSLLLLTVNCVPRRSKMEEADRRGGRSRI